MLSTSQQPDDADTGLKVVEDATCTFCGCMCDDITLKVAGTNIIEAKNACEQGKAWFLNHAIEERPACTVDGRPATLEAGIDRAARILIDAKYPLLYGLSRTTCEAQRVAVSIADWIGANVDTPTSIRRGPTGVTFQGVGEVTCTLGEIRNRGDLIIYWGADPAESHPRHFAKHALTPVGQFVPNGRKGRYAVVVDVRKTESADACDELIQIKPGKDFEALWTLRALAKGLDLDPPQVLAETGVTLETFQTLMARMKRARYGVFLYGSGLTTTAGKHLNIEALSALARDMNAHTRFVSRQLRGRGNAGGADNVTTWRTGFPFAVNMSRGYPRFNPGEYSAVEMLARREADAALIVADDPMSDLGPAAREHLASIPVVALDSKETPTTRAAAVAFCTAAFGINTPGTVYRLDDVPLPLRPALDSPYPSDQDVLAKIEKRILELKQQPASAAVPEYTFR